MWEKTVSVQNSVFIRVNNVSSFTLSSWNTWACYLADLTFYSRRTGLICWLRPKVVLDVYSAVVELLNCWVVCSCNWRLDVRILMGERSCGRHCFYTLVDLTWLCPGTPNSHPRICTSYRVLIFCFFNCLLYLLTGSKWKAGLVWCR